MDLIQFLLQNLHFAVGILASLAVFSAAWLYFDGWLEHRLYKDLPKWIGFLLLAIGFVIYAAHIEESVFGTPIIGSAVFTVGELIRLAGYITLIIGQIIDPLQAVPKFKGLEQESPKSSKSAAVGMIGTIPWLALPAASFAVAILYWRRATTGLERHLKPIAISFVMFTLFEIGDFASRWGNSTDIIVRRVVGPFGIIWIITEILLFTATALLIKWVWRYLLERFMSQLFMVFISSVVAIFLVVTGSFTFLLLRDIRTESLRNLTISSSVLDYAIDNRKKTTAAQSEVIARLPEITAAVAAKDHAKLVALTKTTLADRQLSSLIITGDSGQVLYDAEEPDRYGQSVSSDALIARALLGEAVSSVTSIDAVVAPKLRASSVYPVRDATGLVIGSVQVGIALDNAFLDGLKAQTGLDGSVLSGSIRSATTFTAADGTTRWVGVKQTDDTVNTTVLKSGKSWSGAIDVQNEQYLGIYSPLLDADNTPVGMTFVGKPENSILAQAGHSISLTFALSALLIALAAIPAYLVSRYLSNQIK
jgi:hypothetical protein